MLGSKPEAREDVTRVDDQRRPVGKRGIVDGVVVGRDKNGIEAANRRFVEDDRPPALQGHVFARRGDFFHMGVVEGGLAAALLDEFYQLQGGAFANVRNILLVGEADDEDRRAAERLAMT